MSTGNRDGENKLNLSWGQDSEELTNLLFENQLLNYKQAAQYLGISRVYLRRLKSRRLIAYVQVGDRGIRFRVSSLNKWIESREVKCRREN